MLLRNRRRPTINRFRGHQVAGMLCRYVGNSIFSFMSVQSDLGNKVHSRRWCDPLSGVDAGVNPNDWLSWCSTSDLITKRSIKSWQHITQWTIISEWIMMANNEDNFQKKIEWRRWNQCYNVGYIQKATENKLFM